MQLKRPYNTLYGSISSIPQVWSVSGSGVGYGTALGIGLYGISASGLQGLRNVGTLKTTILQIKRCQPMKPSDIAKGEADTQCTQPPSASVMPTDSTGSLATAGEGTDQRIKHLSFGMSVWIFV